MNLHRKKRRGNGGRRKGAGDVAASRWLGSAGYREGSCVGGRGRGPKPVSDTLTGVYEKGLGWVGGEKMVAWVVADIGSLSLPALRHTSKPPADREVGAGTGGLGETGRATGGRSRGGRSRGGKQSKLQRRCGGGRGGWGLVVRNVAWRANGPPLSNHFMRAGTLL